MDRGTISTCREMVKTVYVTSYMYPVLVSCLYAVAIGQNQPLAHEQEEWTSDVPLTEGQLRGKRDTFWETAPVYEGRKEIWDALRAACEAVEEGDFELAQAIVDGVSLCLPRGKQNTSYVVLIGVVNTTGIIFVIASGENKSTIKL